MTTATEALPREVRVSSSPLDLARAIRVAGALVLAALPGLLTVYLSFNSGGFFAGAQGAVVAILAGTVAVRMAVVRDPFGGFTRPLLVAIAGLSVYSLWALISSHWSHSPARALLEFDLANVYLFALILFGSSARSHRRARWTLFFTWVSMLGVCVVSLATRLRPDLFPIPANLSPNRLAFPLTYWNALGLFAVIGLTLSLHLASSTREPWFVRVLGAAAGPIFGVTILLTFSRAALLLGAGGLLAYALLARPRGLLSALLAGGPPTVFAVLAAYHANLISNASTSAAAVQQGRHLTTTVLGACLAAGLIRVALFELDRRLGDFVIADRTRRRVRSLLALSAVGAAFVAFFAFDHQISNQWNNFVKSDSSIGSNDVRNRIGSFRIGGRVEAWRIALRSFDQNSFHGHGAGTYSIDWELRRNSNGTALEAHSAYLQAMSELGIVGLVALVTAVVVMIGACFWRSRRSMRSVWIAAGVVGLLWAIHAGVDWDWEMPAVTLPVFALGACALSRRRAGKRLRPRTELGLRIAVGLIAVAVAVTAVRISVSDNHLNQSVTAFNSSDCPAAVADANSAISALPSRPQPYAIIAYCNVIHGTPKLAVNQMRDAVVRDPQNWRYRYGLAIASAAAGLDPRPAIRQALLLDPREPMIQTAVSAFSLRNRHRWRELGAALQMPVSMRE